MEFTIIGVLPPDFKFATENFALWAPINTDSNYRDRDDHNLLVFARLKDGGDNDLFALVIGDDALVQSFKDTSDLLESPLLSRVHEVTPLRFLQLRATYDLLMGRGRFGRQWDS